MTDRRVFLAALLAFSFWLGMDVGHWRARDQIATTCAPQPGEKLLATHTQPDGTVLCEFGNGYGRSAKTRKAS